MTKALYDEFGIQMHTAYAALINQSSLDGFDALAHIMNVVTQAARNDKRFEHEMLYLKTGIATMNQIANKCQAGLPLKEHESAAIGVAVSAIDRVLPYMDVSKLYVAMNEMRVQQCLPQ
jgi:hypothetical protein